jgi:hypothetical protein
MINVFSKIGPYHFGGTCPAEATSERFQRYQIVL